MAPVEVSHPRSTKQNAKGGPWRDAGDSWELVLREGWRSHECGCVTIMSECTFGGQHSSTSAGVTFFVKAVTESP